jgi:hypothetical protein
MIPGLLTEMRVTAMATGAAIVLLLTQPMDAAPTAAATDSIAGKGYRIDQPGTITFTVGVKISGKVEKPQVMIFLPKEKTLYREEVFTRSFRDELMQTLPFTPQTR